MAKQLHMRADLSQTTQELCLPQGYWLRNFRDTPDRADEKAWDAIVQESFGENSVYLFENFIRPKEAFLPERVKFVCHGEECVATASAWRYRWLEEGWGGIHMVGARLAHRGKSLGACVTKAAMLHLKSEGCRWAWLTTDDPRLGAIQSYLRLGFQPVVVEEEQWERWEKVFEHLKRPWDPSVAYVYRFS